MTILNRLVLVMLCAALTLSSATACQAGAALPSATSQPPLTSDQHALAVANNSAVVQTYFHDVLDEKHYELLPKILTQDVVMHRSDGTLSGVPTVQTMFDIGLAPHRITTTIHELVASDDYVAVRLTHTMTYSPQLGVMPSPLGRIDVRGKTITWDAMALFRFEDGRIAEEWVSADDLGKLLQVGTLQFAADQ